jgi:sulfur relay (sulfurtransferase) DsrC/TusE family protein
MKRPRPHARATTTDVPEWAPEDAGALALQAGIARLTDRHWMVIASCREEAARCGHAPGLRRLQMLTGLDAGELRELFPGKVETLIARIAGLTRDPIGPRARLGGGSLED